MKGLAASLLDGAPIELARLANQEEKAKELTAVQVDIKTKGVCLPYKRQAVGPVLKLNFDGSTTIADPCGC
jgi:hypothetical protein